ncbi:MAG TPA: hypothetical protein VF152_08820, partial [Acidimicrobiia bacterium]
MNRTFRSSVLAGRGALIGLGLLGLAAAGCVPFKKAPPSPPGPQPVVESFGCATGAQTWAVPAGITEATFRLLGGQGGSGPPNQFGT